MTFLDPYDRRARVSPGLLAILPLAVAVFVLGFTGWRVASSLLSVAGAFGGSLVLSLWVRERGIQAQERLWSRWGNPPINEALLRDTVAAEERRAKLNRLVGIPVAYEDREQTDRAVKALFRLIGDKERHPLVFTENCNYGFMRNLYGIRAAGRASSIIGLIAVVSMLGLDLSGQTPNGMRLATSPLVMGTLANVALLFFWLLFPREARVRRANELLRDRVIETLDTLPE